MIDRQKVVDIYNNLGIPSWTIGKNVTQGWVNITCPFCSDSSNHCGMNPETALFHCWICGKKGHFVDLLMELTDLSYGACKEMVVDSATSFKERPLDRITNILQGESPEETEVGASFAVCKLPERFELITKDTYSPLLESYLKRRNILRDTLIAAGCGLCRSGEYMNRMVIPVMQGGKLVAYQAADMSGFAGLKYRSSPLSMGNINDYLYNYDEIVVGGRMIVTEGILDAWRVGKEAAAAFTSSLSKKQIKLIIAKELDELYICFDTELKAYYKSKKQAEEFRAYIPVVEVVKLPFGKDPDDLDREEIYRCIQEARA